MSPSTRATVLFWCQVSLYVSAMVTMLGILITLVVFVISTMRTMDENRARDRAMLQQHQQSLQHGEHLLQESRQALQDHQRQMERLGR